MAHKREFHARAERIEELVNKLEAAGDPELHTAALELLQSVMDLHGAALQRVMEIISHGNEGDHLTQQLLADDMVASLLLLHGLHPEDMETRVLRAVDKVRPRLQPHGGDVEVVGVENGAVRLRLHKNGGGCASTGATLKAMVEDAVTEAAPDADQIVVETAEQPSGPQLVTIK